MTSLLKPSTIKDKSPTKIVSQQKNPVPLLKKESIIESENICKTHSSSTKKQFIKFININHFEPIQRKKKLGINVPFLCDVCLSELKKKRNSKQAMQHVKSLKQFKTQYVDSLLKMLSEQKDLESKMENIEKAQQFFNKQINKMAEQFNKAIEGYKNVFMGIFKSVKKPFDRETVDKFTKGQFNEQSVRQLYSNSKKASIYSSLFGDTNQKALEILHQGLNNSIEEIQKLVKDELFKSQYLLKSVLKLYKAPQIIKNLESQIQKEQNGTYQSNIWLKIKAMSEQRKKALSKKKQISQNKRKNSIKSSEKQPTEQKPVPGSQRKKLPSQKQSKPLQKHKIIRRKRLQKPAKRQDVIVVGEEFRFQENKKIVLYLINKTHTQRVKSQEINRLPSAEFKRMYPQAYNEFQTKQLKKLEQK